MLRTLWHRHTHLFIFLLVLPILFIEARTENDFDIFITAARDWSNGLNPYTQLYHEWYHYFYDITFLSVLALFQTLPNYWIKLIWLALQVVMLFEIWRIVLDRLNITKAQQLKRWGFGFVLVLFNVRLLRDNLHLGQMTILLLFLSLKGLDLIFKQKSFLGSALLAWGIVVKVLPIVVIPYLAYRKQWKATIATVALSAGYLALPYLYQNTTQYSDLLKSRWLLLNPTNAEHILDTSERSFHSMTTLTSILFHAQCDDLHILPYRRHIVDCDVQTVKWISLISRLALVCSFLWVLRSKPFDAGKDENHFREWAYLLMLIPLIFPHQQHYAFFMMMPGLAWLIARYWTGAKIWKWHSGRTWLLVFIFITMNVHFLLGVWSGYYNHFKVLTYGGLAALGLMWYEIYSGDRGHQKEQP